MASITFKHVNKTYPGNVTVVPDLNLEIQDKEFVILVGPSGCGKSTTLRMIAGLEDITSGELYIGDRLVNDVAPKDRDIAMVFQNYALYPHMTVYKNIAFGLLQQKVPKDEIDRRVHEAARALDLESLLNRKPKALSGGQRQRVSLGRAMVRNPAVFLLDEPLSNLDAKLRTTMRSEISRLHKRLQTTFVYVTHDQTEAMTMGDRIVVMKDGVIQQNDAPQVLYDYPCNLFVAGFIGSPQMNFLDAVISKQGDGYAAQVCGSTVALPPRMNEAVAPYVGKTVVLGIRPEDIIAVDAGQGAGSGMTSTVEIAELMGAEISLHVDCQGSRMVIRTEPTFKGREGDTAMLTFKTEKIHLFDKETEQAIAH
ncbi:ABC transporter ATP-binding protein [uncultured Flavonifractor sp.]|uniref:ABC transporter ATP-binding protein n=1 Tax=uncultured Flavonifractor sp. TaxID=1193534 RepID=UPI002621F65A|nr:sn-glycerol-3-phosphate ABC transporter ATP-binding protein UgpC [uncultured Flavonifractor sp.]